MRKTLLLGLAALLGVLPLTACEDDEDEEITILRAALAPLNSPARPLSGNAEIEIARGILRAELNATGLDSVTHIQFIGSGDRCPTASHDTNGDGNIDIREGMVAFGSVLLALDSSLAVNEASLTGEFPTGISYNYLENGLFTSVESSLRPTPTNDFTSSIPTGDNFDPEGMPVVVLGVSRNLPRTVATLPGFTESETLPIACGVLIRVNDDDDDSD